MDGDGAQPHQVLPDQVNLELVHQEDAVGEDGRGPQRETAGLASDGKHLGELDTQLLDVGLGQLGPALPEQQR